MLHSADIFVPLLRSLSAGSNRWRVRSETLSALPSTRQLRTLF
jgi:hypothetical protein